MQFSITPRTVLAILGAVVLAYFAGYGLGNVSAKTYMQLTAETPASLSNW